MDGNGNYGPTFISVDIGYTGVTFAHIITPLMSTSESVLLRMINRLLEVVVIIGMCI